MIFSVFHKTSYSYEAPVSLCHNIATIRPRESSGQKLLDFSLQIQPEPTDISERRDFFGNHITRFSIQKSHKKLVVISRSTVDRQYADIRDTFFSDACKRVTLQQAWQTLNSNAPEIIDAKQFILESILIRNTDDAIKKYAEVSFYPDRSVFEATYELMQRIYTDFDFVPGFTTVSTPLGEVMIEKKGVCQDFAQIAIACIRSIGLPAKYISGYIETLPPPGKQKLIGVDASHAWFAVYIPNFGWVDFDPTNNQIPKDQHIVVGWGRDYYDVPPLKGVVFGSGLSKLKVSVDIRSEEEAKLLDIA
ncbi:transglutaminase family protein [Aquimarina sp. ERC-38]|uniref:transglutaminase family protein n=1 Tax=Aquimarina sp. ERC-38 TaxID=2949996 RepID=UPI0022461982|nr:transglutaminase family protein [Aquimarina sp. ERC-38]UZO82360.1 transglutaminase family protein [Aquimarina sp. ERC-38]